MSPGRAPTQPAHISLQPHTAGPPHRGPACQPLSPPGTTRQSLLSLVRTPSAHHIGTSGLCTAPLPRAPSAARLEPRPIAVRTHPRPSLNLSASPTRRTSPSPFLPHPFFTASTQEPSRAPFKSIVDSPLPTQLSLPEADRRTPLRA
jgi:hypothetical protein